MTSYPQEWGRDSGESRRNAREYARKRIRGRPSGYRLARKPGFRTDTVFLYRPQSKAEGGADRPAPIGSERGFKAIFEHQLGKVGNDGIGVQLTWGTGRRPHRDRALRRCRIGLDLEIEQREPSQIVAVRRRRRRRR